MKNIAFALVIAAFASFETRLCAEEKERGETQFSVDKELSEEIKSEYVNHIVLDGFVATYEVPGFILDMASSKLFDHPDSLLGASMGFRLMYEVSKDCSVGAQLTYLTASGSGEWSRTDDDSGREGIEVGKIDLSVLGGELKIERKFLSDPIRPYLRLGLGAGSAAIKFKGKFVGHETTSGNNLPLVLSAADAIHKTIPLFGLDLGVQWKINEKGCFDTGVFWDTGYGIELSLRITF